MIRLLLVLLIAVPGTAWYAWEVVWAVLRRSPNMDCVCYHAPRKWSRLMLRVAGVRVVLQNLEAIRDDKPQVLVANHVSWYDVFALAANIPSEYVFVAKKEVKRFPILGRAITACRHIYIDRSDHQKAIESMEAVRKRLGQNNPTIVMFAEGTRSPTGELQRFKKGAFVLAIETQTEIVPVAVSGSRAVMRKGSLLIHSGTITVRFGNAIPVEGLAMDRRDELLQQTREAVAGLMDAGLEATN